MEDIKKGQINYGKVWPEHEAEFYLNHSCDEWVIGDLEAAKEFRDDLSYLIEKVENTKL